MVTSDQRKIFTKKIVRYLLEKKIMPINEHHKQMETIFISHWLQRMKASIYWVEA